MDRDLLLEFATPAQADIVIEKARQLGCWPDDLVIEWTSGPDLLVTAGRRKGRARTLRVAPDGRIST